MTPELDYVILESEYNVIMALVNCYKKEYVMECYYMENNLNSAGSKIINGVSNAGQRIDQGFNNAIQKGNNAVNKLGQRIDNSRANMSQHPVTDLSNKIQNGINKLLGWCKKASNFIVLNTKKIPPETQVQAPPQTQQLRQAAETYTQVNQRATQILSQPDNPQNEQQMRQITNELAEIEKKIKALQIKKTLLEKQQQELNQPQPLPPLKFNKPQQQQTAPQQPQPQPAQQQPTQPQQTQQQQSQPVQQNGFVTIKAGDFQALIAQIQKQQAQTEKAINQSLQQANQAANNAQSAVSQTKQQLMNQAVKTEATILNDCVEITRDMKQQVNGNTSDARPITGAQLAQMVVRLMKNSDVPNQYTYNPQTQTFNLVNTNGVEYDPSTGGFNLTQNRNRSGEFIWDSETTLMYPIIMNTPTSIPNVYGVYKISNVRRIDDNTVIIPAQVIKPGFLADANTLRLFKPGVIKNPTQPQQQNGNIG